MPRGCCHFQIINKINDNAYKMNLLDKYGISTAFNVSYLFLFNVDNESRSNWFEERKDDTIQPIPKYH